MFRGSRVCSSAPPWQCGDDVISCARSRGFFEVRNKSIVRLAIPVAIAAGASLLAGCGGGSGGAIKIAYQGPLSGDNVALGQNMENGIQLAIDEANESGDYDFELEYFPADDGGVEGQATTAAQLAIDDPDVVATIGPAFSGPSEVALPLYSESGLTAMTTSATNPTLTQEGFETFLRAVPNDNAQGTAMGEFLASRDDVESVMVISDGSPYGEGLSDQAVTTLEDEGLSVQRETVPGAGATPDYSSAARTVADSGVDALIYAGYYADLGPFITRLGEAGYDGIGISGDGSNDAELVNLAGDASEGWYLTCPCTDATQNEATAQFAERYQEAYDEPPGTYSAESYDATKMIIEAIGELGGDPTREELYDQLAGMTYEGLTKEFAFDDNGEFVNDTIYFYQVDGGAIGYLGETSEVTGG
ncbi:branched-chain amino acid ABC transporter substrate-binding protein [Streptomyces sp. 6N223]|uniref:branched-chain amino acid ABC transporter substrate-binding protein n=1 Tax=Streptomyces sp. 6N223 TaxID=3457412 RepID=UPI003FD64CB5